ncbi:MAG: neutral/alkaline non-lysosomal ceramidase N-terminal domain-containing protein, partial [Planctomycetota bacterium]
VEGDGGERVLWLHADLIGFEAEDVARIKQALHQRFGFAADEVCLSATHTHSGPATIRLLNCGEYHGEYVAFVEERLIAAAMEALRTAAPAKLEFAEGQCELAIDRRGKPTKHVDPRVGVLAWRRIEAGGAGGAYVAVLANYGMHNVAMGHENRLISADMAGRAAHRVAAALPGRPVVLFTNGGAGNLNPPAVGHDFGRMEEWGDRLAAAVLVALDKATPAGKVSVRAAARTLALPTSALSEAELDEIAARHIQPLEARSDYVSGRIRAAVLRWRTLMRDSVAERRGQPICEVAIQVVSFGPVALACFGAEVFSCAAEQLRARVGRPVYVVSYANGLIGYLAPRVAHEEGGYETAGAFIFYGRAPLAPGGFERALDTAADLLR